ncbi:hypothetical protein DEJ50_00845 [Streptomyces venezuelae]|uniref:Uncharacterized protein n=1 Tax=Streptomyces venezuelae TaxID=54571 RepID=A0A5P2CWF9_STRVZ|nr:hypothetical protein [Streptomyces venezuelae]QES46610.1 hypothetical protein DEJ50_00845 [Streptomyces venezuelae]
MDERGDGPVAWHVLEEVPAGWEEIPGLLRGLVTPGQRQKAWLRLEDKLGWRTDAPLFAHTVTHLLDLLPRLDERRLVQVLDFLARRGHSACRSSVGVHRRAYELFTNAWPHVLPLAGHRAAGVRTGAAWVLRAIRCADPAALDALRGRAAVEDDPTALMSQLLAMGELSEDREWLLPWLDHGHPLVALAAARGVLASGGTAGAGGTDTADGTDTVDGAVGRAVARGLAAAGKQRLPDVPWWPLGFEPAERFAKLSAPHPYASAALVEAVAGHRDAGLRRAAVLAAGARLRYWRGPAPELWETVAAGLDDEPEVASASVGVLAGGGAAAAPYADRLVRHVERTGGAAGGRDADTALRALVGVADDRAAGWYAARLGSHWLDVAPVPVSWAPLLLPVFRRRLADDGGQPQAVPRILRTLAEWGPAASPAVPELVGLLDTPFARAAAEALGAIGPAAATGSAAATGRAAGRLAALATADPGPGRHPWHGGAQTAAWAYWRITGDPEPALQVCGAAARAGLGQPVLRYLADLGPQAAAYADAVRPLLTCPGQWSRVGAADAWWRITGDAGPAVEALLPELAPLAGHSAPPLVLRTVRILGAIGGPAVAAVPVLHEVASSPRRYGGIPADEELLRAVREALTAIEQGFPSGR